MALTVALLRIIEEVHSLTMAPLDQKRAAKLVVGAMIYSMHAITNVIPITFMFHTTVGLGVSPEMIEAVDATSLIIPGLAIVLLLMISHFSIEPRKYNELASAMLVFTAMTMCLMMLVSILTVFSQEHRKSPGAGITLAEIVACSLPFSIDLFRLEAEGELNHWME